MILDIPTENDFYKQGILFLNLAWDEVIELLLKYNHEVDRYDDLIEKNDIEKYWSAAQGLFAKAVALSHQGAEFLLKSKIAKISPFLLLSSNPDSWPKKCDKDNTFFSEFRTADAQDLIKIHNTVAEERLSESFIYIFNKIRKTRNSIFHTVDKTLSFTGKGIIIDILSISHELVGKCKWIELREDYLVNMRPSLSVNDTDLQLIKEMIVIVELLENKQLVDNFGFSKKIRRYYCHDCYDSWHFSVYHDHLCEKEDEFELEILLERDFAKFAQLRPNTPESNNLYCFICRQNIQVQRKKCDDPTCKGNVIDAKNSKCLTCHNQKQMLRIQLADGKVREIEHSSVTLLLDRDGQIISEEECLRRLFGELPKLFQN